jgi:hypothetical protein
LIWLPIDGAPPPAMLGGITPRSTGGEPWITGSDHIAGLSANRFNSTVPTSIVIANSAGGMRISILRQRHAVSGSTDATAKAARQQLAGAVVQVLPSTVS